MNRELLTAFDNALQRILATLPVVHRSLSTGSLETEARWKLLRQHANELAERPLPVVTLMGPSGSGKSTIFRMLTGLDVPAGGAVRPMTHQSMLAVPDDLGDASLRSMFADVKLEALPDPTHLRRSDVPGDVVFYKKMSSEAATHGDFILADVPDFSTICLENWEKAGRMLARAEVVVFVVEKRSYANYQTMIYLARACALAGHLAYVTTMANTADANLIWQDLVQNKTSAFVLRREDQTDDGDIGFFKLRADGRTRAEFLATADTYASVESSAPQLADIISLKAGAPPLAEFLKGRNIACLMLAKRANDIQQGLKLADDLLSSHASRLDELKGCRDQIENQLADEKLDIVGNQLPIGEILGVVLQQAENVLPWWRRCGAYVMKPVWGAVKNVYSALKWAISNIIKSEEKKAVSREENERDALDAEANKLVDSWRKQYGEKIEIPHERCANALESFRAQKTPEPAEEWDEFAARRASEWVKDNPNSATMLLSFAGLVAVLAGAFVVVDIVHGGAGTALKVLLTKMAIKLGIDVTLATALDRLLQLLGMEKLIEDFQIEWKRQRNFQLRAHLREHFARRLILDELNTRLSALEKAPVDACYKASGELRKILAELDFTS